MTLFYIVWIFQCIKLMKVIRIANQATKHRQIFLFVSILMNCAIYFEGGDERGSG